MLYASRLSRALAPLTALALLMAGAAGTATAQSTPDDTSPPSVSFAPDGGSVVSQARLHVTITYTDARLAGSGSRSIYLNGTPVSSAFTYAGTSTTATDTGTVTLAQGSNVLSVHVCDFSANCTGDVTPDPAATYTLQPAAVAVSVAAPNGTTTAATSRTGQTLAFTVTNTGTSAGTFNLAVSCTVPLSACSAPASVTLAAGYATSVSATYSTSPWAGSGTVRLTATAAADGSVRSTGTVAVTTAAAPKVSVEVNGPTYRYQDGTFSQVFTVRNPGPDDQFGTLTPRCDGVATACAANALLGVPAAGSQDITVTGSLGGSGAGRVQLAAATSTGGSDSAYVELSTAPAATYTVAVLPRSDSVSVGTLGTAVQYFTIRNTGNQPTASPTYNLSVACSGAIGACSLSSPVAAPLGGTWTRVAVTYTAGAAAGVGRIRVLATMANLPSVQDSGWVNVKVQGGGIVQPVVGVADVNPRGTLDRGNCMRISVGAGESECGDLVYGHALPAVRVLNRSRAPMLLYNSQTAHPRPVVMATVTIPAGAAQPDSVRARLLHNGLSVASATWAGAGFAPGTAKRVSLGFDASGASTGLYAYSLEVTALYPGGPKQTVVGDTLAVVNRAGSPFGAGWWLNGLEQVVDAGAAGMLWIGGDGSTRLYRSSGVAGLWLAEESNATDSLVRVDASYFARKLNGGGEVRFSAASGMQTATVNRVGLQTDFTWDTGRGVLTGIGLPHGNGFSPPLAGWTFSYSGTPALLDAVSVASATAGSVRTVRIGRSGSDVTLITDPDTAAEGFVYLPGVAHVWSDHLLYDRTGQAYGQTHFGWHASGKLASARHYAGGLTSTAADPVITVTVPETRGWMGSTPANEGNAYGLIDGPRPDKNDFTYYWTDRYGAPTQTTDALGNVTYIYRRDWRFPGAVTGVDRPGGGSTPGQYTTRLSSTAERDDQGRLVQVVVLNPLGDNRYTLTTYAYGDARRPYDVTAVTSPTGLVTSSGYDPAGNRVWQQVGPDSARRVRFGYDALGRVTWVLSRRAASAGEQPEQVAYDDTLGNVRTVISPGGIRTSTFADAIGRPVLSRSPVDSAQTAFVTDTTLYDAGDRVVQTVTTGPATSYTSTTGTVAVPAQSLVVTSFYDARRQLVAVSRMSSPDPADISTVTTRYKYDELGRKVSEISAGDAADSTVYDPAGNAVQVRTPRGAWLAMQYDALNRLTQRITPPVTVGDSAYVVVPNGSVPNRSTWHFPMYSGSVATGPTDTLSHAGLTIPGDTAVFAYDGSGAMVQADNGDARVRRRYYPNGLLKTDSLQVRDYADAVFGHTYVTAHTYDLDGRLVRTTNPAQLAAADPAWHHASYGYDAATGALSAVADSLGNVADFTYDADGRLLETQYGTVHELQGYDVEGRMAWEKRLTYPGALLQRDTFAYDVRGKRTRVWSLADSTVNAFSGMGPLAWSYTTKYNQQNSPEEFYSTDALANAYGSGHINHSNKAEEAFYERAESHFQPNTGRLLWDGRYDASSETQYSNGTESRYDLAGNRYYFAQYRPVTYAGVTAPAKLQEITFSYYGADDKLRVMDRRSCVYGGVYGTGSFAIRVLIDGAPTTSCLPPEWTDRPTWEEYRYDALGRRVLTRSNQTGWACDGRCVNAVTRTVWDGDQILAEIRAPIAMAEQDTGRVPTGTLFDHGYGQVLYTHGPSLDHPLKVTRLSYDSVFPNPIWITPHTNWQGSYDSGELFNTDNTGTCHKVSSGWYDNTPAAYENGINGQGSESGGPTHPDSVTVCVEMDWPAPYQWKSHLERGRGKIGPASWMGSLIEGGRDLTGQMYMRNRFYDPQSGRFTQEDPTGIVGGLNVYGFAGGDPVNYSDPYGLAPDWLFNEYGQIIGNDGGAAHHFLQYENKKYSLDRPLVPNSRHTPYIIHPNGEGDLIAVKMASGTPAMSKIRAAWESFPGGKLDFKSQGQLADPRQLFIEGNSVVHTDIIGNEAWAYYARTKLNMTEQDAKTWAQRYTHVHDGQGDDPNDEAAIHRAYQQPVTKNDRD